MRVDNFQGDDASYASYLCSQMQSTEMLEIIPHLESKVRQGRAEHKTPPLVFKVYEPPLESNQRPTQRHPKCLPAACSTTAQEFFSNLPQSEAQWRDRREGINFVTEDDIYAVIYSIRTCRHINSNDAELIVSGNLQDDLIAIAKRFGAASIATRLNSCIANFQSLVFTAICEVAIYCGHSLEGVNDAHRLFLTTSRDGTCNASGLTLQKYRVALRGILQEMQRQYRRGLRHRGLEIFFIFGGSITSYTRWSKPSLAPYGDAVATVPDEIHASCPLWIPMFVQWIMGDRWSFENEVCKALKVDLLNTAKDYQRFRASVEGLRAANGLGSLTWCDNETTAVQYEGQLALVGNVPDLCPETMDIVEAPFGTNYGQSPVAAEQPYVDGAGLDLLARACHDRMSDMDSFTFDDHFSAMLGDVGNEPYWNIRETAPDDDMLADLFSV